MWNVPNVSESGFCGQAAQIIPFVQAQATIKMVVKSLSQLSSSPLTFIVKEGQIGK